MKIALKDISGLLPDKKLVTEQEIGEYSIGYKNYCEKIGSNQAIDLIGERQISVEICQQCKGIGQAINFKGELIGFCFHCQGHGLIIRAVDKEG